MGVGKKCIHEVCTTNHHLCNCHPNTQHKPQELKWFYSNSRTCRSPIAQKYITMVSTWDLRFPQQWLLRLLLSKMWCCVVWYIDTNISNELAASSFRVENCKQCENRFLQNMVNFYQTTQCHIPEDDNHIKVSSSIYSVLPHTNVNTFCTAVLTICFTCFMNLYHQLADFLIIPIHCTDLSVRKTALKSETSI
jgi:hypothetical protein